MKLLGIVWAAPITLVALLVAMLLCLRHAKLRYRLGAIDCLGLPVADTLDWLPTTARVDAITLGHVIFSRDEHIATTWCAHERIHVRQYERWGIFLPLAYGIASVIAWTNGECPYRDNAFEREARQPARQSCN